MAAVVTKARWDSDADLSTNAVIIDLPEDVIRDILRRMDEIKAMQKSDQSVYGTYYWNTAACFCEIARPHSKDLSTRAEEIDRVLKAIEDYDSDCITVLADENMVVPGEVTSTDTSLMFVTPDYARWDSYLRHSEKPFKLSSEQLSREFLESLLPGGS